MLFNFTDGGTRNAKRALDALVSMPSDRIAELQREVARIAARLTYRGERRRRGDEVDAVDVLVNELAARFESRIIATHALRRGVTRA